MDSLSHIAMGTGIVAISHVVPEIATSDKKGLFLFGAIIASIIPDFDVVFKAKGQDKFLMIHRGKSHSVFIVAFLAVLTAIGFNQFLDIPFYITMIVYLIAAGMHVFMDLFNNYGTQALWPFRRKWIAWSFTNTADYLIHLSHIAGILLWFFTDINPVYIFTVIYILFATYLTIIYFVRRNLKHRVVMKYFMSDVKNVWLISKSLPHQWKYICETADNYYVGTISGSSITQADAKIKDEHLPEKYFNIVKDDIAYKNFVDFSRVYYWHKRDLEDGAVRIKYTDLRYLNDKGHYTFNVVFDFDKNMDYVRHIGWVFNQPSLERKLARKASRKRG